MTIREFIEKKFSPQSRPTRNTMIDWICRGHLKGYKLGTRWYIEDSELDNLGGGDTQGLSTDDIAFAKKVLGAHYTPERAGKLARNLHDDQPD